MQTIAEYLQHIERIAAIYASRGTSVKAGLTKDDLCSLFAETLVKCSKQFKARRGTNFKTYLNTALKNAWKNALNDSIRQRGTPFTDSISETDVDPTEDNPVEDILYARADSLGLVDNETRVYPRDSQAKYELSISTPEQLAESLALSDLVYYFYLGGPKMRSEFPEVWNFLKGLTSFKCASCGEDFRDDPTRNKKRFTPDDLFRLRNLTQQCRNTPVTTLILCFDCSHNIRMTAFAMGLDFDF